MILCGVCEIFGSIFSYYYLDDRPTPREVHRKHQEDELYINEVDTLVIE